MCDASQPPARQRQGCGWVGVMSVMSVMSAVQSARRLKIPLVNDLMRAVLEGSPHPARSFSDGKGI